MGQFYKNGDRMKKFILVIGIFGVIMCLQASDKKSEELLSRQETYKLHAPEYEGSWTLNTIHGRRVNEEDFLSDDSLHALQQQLQNRSSGNDDQDDEQQDCKHHVMDHDQHDLNNCRDDQAAHAQLDFFGQWRQFFMRIFAMIVGK